MALCSPACRVDNQGSSQKEVLLRSICKKKGSRAYCRGEEDGPNGGIQGTASGALSCSGH